jgi:hypothetical protein
MKVGVAGCGVLATVRAVARARDGRSVGVAHALLERGSADRLGVAGFGVFGHGPGAGAALRARLEIGVL